MDRLVPILAVLPSFVSNVDALLRRGPFLRLSLSRYLPLIKMLNAGNETFMYLDDCPTTGHR